MGNWESDVARQPLLTPTAIANVAFVPTGIVTVLLGPILPHARKGRSMTRRAATCSSRSLWRRPGSCSFGRSRAAIRLSDGTGAWAHLRGCGRQHAAARFLGVGHGVGGWVRIRIGPDSSDGNPPVAEVNPETKASALTLVNFSWSVGAVACPFLLAPFQRAQRTSTFLWVLAACVLVVAVSLWRIAVPPLSKSQEDSATSEESLGSLMRTPAAIALAVLFFTYVGTETAVGGWLASYAKRMMQGAGTMWMTTPSFFYGGLLSGRIFAPALLRRMPEVKLARMSMIVALLGVAGLLASPSVPGG